MRDARKPGDGRPRGLLRRGRSSTAAGVALTVAALLLVASCDADVNRTTPTSAAPTTATSQTIAPVTPDGFSSGPGVTDTGITLGLLVDPDRDRGFTAGVELWQQAVNTSGGLCGRSVRLAANGVGGVPVDPVEAYDAIGRTSLGLITLPGPDEAAALNSRISSDQLPALTPSGTSTQLGPTRPIVVAATEDILAINALGYLEQSGKLAEGASVGVLSDGSAAADNAVSGARWWAAERGVELDVRTVPAAVEGSSADVTTTKSTTESTAGETTAGETAAETAVGPGTSTGSGATDQSADDAAELGDWGDATVVLALTGAATTARLAVRTPADVLVVTTIDGYHPGTWDASALAAAAAGRVLISSAAPAFDSDYPAAVSVAGQFAASGQQDPGPRLFDGYGTGANWGRLLTEACSNRTLTRQAIQLATTTVGAASVDSLFGPTDPAGPVMSGLPATRVSAMSVADPAASTGIRPLTWLQAAAGIGDYVP